MLLEQQFQLKRYAHLSLWEQNNMTAEDRGWWMRRTEKELERERDAQNKGHGDGPTHVGKPPA